MLQFDTEMKTVPQLDATEEPSYNESKSDEDDPLTAFSPVTESGKNQFNLISSPFLKLLSFHLTDLSKNHLMDFESLKLISNSTTPRSAPAKRPPYKRRTTIPVRKSNTKKINDDSDAQSENAPSQVFESNIKSNPKKKKRASRNQNNNNTEIATVKPKKIEISSSVFEVTDHSDETHSSQHTMVVIEVADDTSQNSNDTSVSESKRNLDNKMNDSGSKINATIYYRPKKFEKKAEKNVSVDELIDDWDSASEGGRSGRANRLSCDSDITFTHVKDSLVESDRESIISLNSSNTGGDTRSENTDFAP